MHVALSLEYVKQYRGSHSNLNANQGYLLEQCVVWQRLSEQLGWQCDNVRAAYSEISQDIQNEVYAGARAFVQANKEVTNDYEFTADKENMEVQIEFTFDGSTLGGKQLVTFEELYDMTNPEEPKKVTEHKDINDEGQTVTIKEVPGTPTPETPGTTTKTSNPPKTGDTANAALWIAILVLSAAGITGVRIWNKKKQVKRLGIEEKKEEEE